MRIVAATCLRRIGYLQVSCSADARRARFDHLAIVLDAQLGAEVVPPYGRSAAALEAAERPKVAHVLERRRSFLWAGCGRCQTRERIVSRRVGSNREVLAGAG